MMKQLVAVLLAVATLLSAGSERGTWELSGELIVWEPCSRDFIFAHVAAAQPNRNDLFTVKPEYDAGFRVALGMAGCRVPLFAELTFTYWSGCSSRSVTGTNLRLEVPNFSLNLVRVDGRQRLEYWDVDVCLSRSIASSCNYQINAIGGIRYINVERCDRSTGRQAPPSTPISIGQRNKFSGFAFAGGLSGLQCLHWNFVLRGELLGLVGAGDQTNRWTVFSGAGAGISAYGGSVPSSYTCLTGVHARVSLGKTFCFRCLDLTADLGYEILRYVDALRHVNPISEDAYSLEAYSVGFQGPSLRVAIDF